MKARIFLLLISAVYFIGLAAAAVTLNSPSNGSNLSLSSVSFNCSATSSAGLSNMTLYGNWSGSWAANQTENVSGTSNTSIFSVNGLSQGDYMWNCLEADTSGASVFAASNFTFALDTAPPNITSVSVNQSYLCGTSSQVQVNCTATDGLTGVSNVTITASGPDEVQNYSAADIGGGNYSANIPLNQTGSWNFTCTAFDFAGNSANLSSSTFEVYYSLADPAIFSQDIYLNNTEPIENQNITVNANVQNDGCQAANNFPVSFYYGDPASGGVQIGSNQTVSIPPRSNQTTNVTWLAQIGPADIFVIVDGNNTIAEGNTSDNEANNTVNVGSWEIFFGNVSDTKILADSSMENMTLWFNASASDGKIFIADAGVVVHWNDLIALGRNMSGAVSPNDFSELDSLLNMTGYNDSVSSLFTVNGGGSTPKQTMNFTVQSRVIPYVPVIDSTNNSNFVTGILWDSYYDKGDGQFDVSDNEPVVFATKINSSMQGAYGIYDYEIRIPAKLRSQENAGNSVDFYYELK